jgi:thiamine-monophosphate kinase
MRVSELGEFGLIDLLAEMAGEGQNQRVDSQKQLVAGIGDDAAAWRTGAATELATVDSLVQGVHFTLETTSWKALGWKAMAVNLSDIAAMGGDARYALVSLALPGDTEVAGVADLYRGMIELGSQFGVVIAGGDTSGAPIVVINVTIIGSLRDENKILTRSAARPGDRVAVTGYLGAAAAGLEILKQKLHLDPEAGASLKQAFLKPYPRIAEGQILAGQGVKAAIDISDGLISDLNHICRASRVGARIEVGLVPVHPAVSANFGDRSLELALSGGEDYELLFTAGAGVIDRVTAAASCPVTVIGEVTAGKGITLVDSEGRPVKPKKTGWQHFAPEN